MDNLSKMLSDILADEKSRNMLSELAESLGLSNSQNEEPQKNNLDLSMLSSLLSSSNDEDKGGEDSFDINPEMIMKITGALSSLKTDDKDVTLLRAIKPFISDERKHKVDEAVKILKLLSLLPLLKDSGFLGGIL